MFDGAGVATAADAVSDAGDAADSDAGSATQPDGESDVTEALAAVTPPASGANEVVFIDSRVADVDALIAAMPDGVQIVVLDPDIDGVQQIADALSGYSGLSAIHILSHGAEGTVTLGKSALTTENLEAHADLLATWGEAMSEGGDILLYGCSVGDSDAGQAFIDEMAELTGQDVAASDDATGAAALGGDWVLEATSGTVETASIRGAEADWSHLMDEPTEADAQAWNNAAGTMSGTIDRTNDFHNPARDSTYMDRYKLTGVADGTTVKVYLANDGLPDPYLQIVSADGTVKTYNDDGGQGPDGWDAYLTFTYKAGDIIRATTYEQDASGGYTLYTDVGTLAVAEDVAPSAADSTFTVYENSSQAFQISDFSFDNNGDSDGLYSITITSLPESGTLTLDGVPVTLNMVISASAANSDISDNNFKYTPAANETGMAYGAFKFTVNDGKNDSVAEYTMTINVVPRPDEAGETPETPEANSPTPPTMAAPDLPGGLTGATGGLSVTGGSLAGSTAGNGLGNTGGIGDSSAPVSAAFETGGTSLITSFSHAGAATGSDVSDFLAGNGWTEDARTGASDDGPPIEAAPITINPGNEPAGQAEEATPAADGQPDGEMHFDADEPATGDAPAEGQSTEVTPQPLEAPGSPGLSRQIAHIHGLAGVRAEAVAAALQGHVLPGAQI